MAPVGRRSRTRERADGAAAPVKAPKRAAAPPVARARRTLVVVYAAIGAGLLHLWARNRLAGRTLTDEDRVLQTVAGGLLIMAVGFSLVSVLVDAVA